MSTFDNTLANLAPGVSSHQQISGTYYPRKGLAIYALPVAGYSIAAPGTTLGEALSARSGLGCTLLEGIPARVPTGAVVVGQYNAIKAARPDLLQDVPDIRENGSYVLRIANHALVTSHSREGLASGMQTLAMLVLRHGEPEIPGVLIVDKPACHLRGLAVEFAHGEVNINLLMQIVSFAATFKANRLSLILGPQFNPAVNIPGIEVFVQTCQSYGMGVGVRLPWLGKILSGEKSLVDAWSGVRAAARLFGASYAALDDPCPAEVDPLQAARVVDSLLKGEVGLAGMEVDIALVRASGADLRDLRALGVTAWTRMRAGDMSPGQAPDDMPLLLDVEAPVPGFSAEAAETFHHRLDAAVNGISGRQRRELLVSYRNLGVSHLWQNMLLPSATGLIAAWGNPSPAARAAELFAALLYGDSAMSVLAAWNATTSCFPHGLKPEGENLVRRAAFGFWPETEADWVLLSGIDWIAATQRIRAAADVLKDAVADLTRNAVTLAGAKLSLHALSWLHCFVALVPELARRRREGDNRDGRTGPIATELLNNFMVWRNYLLELQEESGLDLVELRQLETMGQRLKSLCQDMIEPGNP